MADHFTPPFPIYATPPLVGRERELALLRDALAAALAGRGSLVRIGGEAGIGKTAFAEALLAEATAQGALALVGRCYDLSETPPYGPWRELFDRAPRDDALPALPVAVLPVNREGADLASQEAIVARVRGYLDALAARHPLVLLLDDLHWADPASLDLLRALGRGVGDLPLLLLATYRADELTRRHPLYQLLPALEREARATRLDLRRLDLLALRALVEAYTLAEDAAQRLATWLHVRAEGNAFFTAQLLRALEDEGTLARMPAGWALGDLRAVGVPAPLRQVLDARIDRLGEAARHLLALAAVVGQEVPLALWAAVARVAEEALLDTVERAVGARLLEAHPTGDAVRFAHALVREALYEGLLPPRRRDWHRRVAEALLAERAPDPDAMAYHLQRAGDPRAVEWLVKAGNRARRALAPRIAAERYDTAMALLPDDHDPAARGWLLAYLAAALHPDDPHGGIGHLREALRLATLAGDKALAAYARYLLGFSLSGLGDYRQGIPELMAGVAAMEDLTPEERLRVGNSAHYPGMHLSTLALRLAHMGHYEQARALALQANARGDEQHANVALAEVHAALGHVAEALSLRTRCYAAVRRDGPWFNLGVFLYLGLQRLVIPYQADQVEQRRQLAAEATAAFARSQVLQGEESPRLGHLPLLVIECEWSEASALAMVVEAGSRTYRPAAVSLLADLAFAQGARALGEALIRKTLPTGPDEEPGGVWLLTGLRLQRLAALWAIEDGDLATARAWLAAHDRWLAWSGAVLGLAEGRLAWAAYCRAAGDLAAASAHAERALAHASDPRQPLALLAAHRLLGELATTGRRYADAQAHLDTSIALADACAAPYERALTLLALAEWRVSERRATAAEQALSEARAILAPLGARPALARAAAIADRLAEPASLAAAAPALPFGLTPREAEVLRLVAEGLTDAQIAARLFVSRFTVNGHTRAIYGKLGVSSRTAAARLALDHGLR